VDDRRRECDVSVIILAGGTGRRFGSTSVPKLLTNLKGKPLIAYSLETALSLEFAHELVVVCHPSIKRQTDELVSEMNGVITRSMDKVVVCEGDDSRAASVECGLKHATGRCVMIHDGDRPLATAVLYRRVLDALKPGVGVVPAINPIESVIQKDHEGRPIGYIPRDQLLLAQTPQAFITKEYREARERVQSRNDQHTDDGSVFAAGGYNLVAVPGEQSNVKVTFAVDVRIVESYLEAMKDE
jgi:2-C-methyl-D-erythritol 4-phosphate cytidylyltransferase